MKEHVPCNLCGSVPEGGCGSNHYKVIYKPKKDAALQPQAYTITDDSSILREQIVRCLNCGLMYVNPRINARSLYSNYLNMVDERYMEEEVGRRITAKRILSALGKYKKPGKLLEVGCATGLLLDEARKVGWEVHGVEISRWASQIAKERFSLDVFCDSLKKAPYQPGTFDAVVMVDVIEHLPNPKDTFVYIRHLLKPDGILCVNTPDVNSPISRLLKTKWWGIKQAHLFYFSKKTLRKMLEASGFDLIGFRGHARTFSIKYWLEKLKVYGGPKDMLITLNLGDQIEAFAHRSRKLSYLNELETSSPLEKPEPRKKKVVIVLPAYNAAKTLKRTLQDIPRRSADEIILVDDASKDNTVEAAKRLGLKHIFRHEVNKGYGGNQKTCYAKALELGADIVVMLHPDYQYDPKVIPDLIAPIKEGRADAVFGSRMMKGGALEGGMPLWKHSANIILTALENIVLGTYLSEYHSGFRAYSRRLLETVRFLDNSDGFIFDTEIIVQILFHNLKIEEIPIRTRYFDEASTITFWPSVIYGFGILKTLLKATLHRSSMIRFSQFE